VRGRVKPIERFCAHLLHQWNAYNVPRLSAGLAYYAAVSLAPMLVILMGVISLVFGQEAARRHLLEQVCDQIGPQGAKVVEDLLQHIADQRHGGVVTVIGLAVVLFGASGVFLDLRDSLNMIWKATPAAPGNWKTAIKIRLTGFAMVLATGFCLTVMVAIGAVATAAGKYVEQWKSYLVWVVKLVDPIVSVTLATLLFALIYRFVPDKKIPWPHALTGAFTTAVLFVAGKLAIGLYIGKTGVGSAYGAAGSLIALLVWIYYSSQVFLLGAILTHAQAQKKRIAAAMVTTGSLARPTRRKQLQLNP